jgi:hypothetical protein
MYGLEHNESQAMTATALPSTNEAQGFFGTIRHHADPAEAWSIAMRLIGDTTDSPDEAVRDFLDSRHGRHFADDVANGVAAGLALPQAIQAAVDRWEGWRIDRRTSRATGIPQGMPYLLGFVTDCEIAAEAAT